VRRDLNRRLARAEIAVSATSWADQQRAKCRQKLRVQVEVCALIREELLAMGLDPALAVSLRVGEEAAAELAAIPDSEALRQADDAITRGDVGDLTEARRSLAAELARIAAFYRNGNQLDLRKATLIVLLAFCVANASRARA
jgi:hypothetical protein